MLKVDKLSFDKTPVTCRAKKQHASSQEAPVEMFNQSGVQAARRQSASACGVLTPVFSRTGSEVHLKKATCKRALGKSKLRSTNAIKIQ